MNFSDIKSVWQSFQRDTTLTTGHSKKSTLGWILKTFLCCLRYAP